MNLLNKEAIIVDSKEGDTCPTYQLPSSRNGKYTHSPIFAVTPDFRKVINRLDIRSNKNITIALGNYLKKNKKRLYQDSAIDWEDTDKHIDNCINSWLDMMNTEEFDW